MLPCASSHDIVDVLPIDAVLSSELGSAVDIGNIFGSHPSYNLVGDFRFGSGLSSARTRSRYHISDIFSLRSFDNMTRIDASGNIASMARARSGPTPISQVERNSMRENHFPMKSASSVTILVFPEWPDKAFIGVVDGYGMDDPVGMQVISVLISHAYICNTQDTQSKGDSHDLFSRSPASPCTAYGPETEARAGSW